MKIITSIARVLVGGLFIFSGIIKSNDPKGTGIKFNEYFDVFAQSVKVDQDTINIDVKNDEYEIHDFYSYSINDQDENLKIEMNQSALQNRLFEGDEDSTYGSNIYINKDGGEMYAYFYELDSAENTPEMTLKVYLSGSKNDVLVDKTLKFSAMTKHEFAKQIDLKPYVNRNGFWYSFFISLKSISLLLAIVMCILEVVLGFAILIGWQPKIMSWLILKVILFFTFLTWYSAYFNKVTDCGCFGDFIKLDPWHSFIKDLILLILILIIFIRRKHIIPLFSPLFNINAMILVVLASSTFAVYCNMYLPAWDFLPYKAGNNIRQMMTPPEGALLIDKTENVLIYQKGNVYDSLVFPKMPKDTSWKFVKRIDRVLEVAWKSEIHDFNFNSGQSDGFNLTDTLLMSKSYSIMVVASNYKKGHMKSWVKIKKLAEEAKKAGIGFYVMTSSPLTEANAFAMENQLPFEFRNADETLLKTIVRSNPGVILWHNGVILDKWSCRSIPSIKKIKKFMK